MHVGFWTPTLSGDIRPMSAVKWRRSQKTLHFTLILYATNTQSWNCVDLNDTAAAREFVEFISAMKSKSRVSTLQQRRVFKSLSRSVYEIAWIQLKFDFP